MIYVLAGNKIQADMYCRDNGIHRHIYVSDLSKMMGSPQNSTLILVGDFYERKDANDIILCAKARNMKIDHFGELSAWVEKGCVKE